MTGYNKTQGNADDLPKGAFGETEKLAWILMGN
jgi:hypothetical protein